MAQMLWEEGRWPFSLIPPSRNFFHSHDDLTRLFFSIRPNKNLLEMYCQIELNTLF